MKNRFSEIKKWIYSNRALIILFVLSTAYFLYQNTIALSWDFATYVENARYLFSSGSYFEPLRPPLMPFILGLLSVFGYSIAEITYIILISSLFMYSSIKLAESLKFNKVAFYALSLNSYVLIIGLINGTELLSIALLELSIAMLIKNRSISGFFLALSALARYTGLALFPFLLLLKHPKKIAKSLFLFSIPLSVWMAYNYLKFGNMFTSLADQYANNILYRSYLIGPVEPIHFLLVLNILLPFFMTGLFSAIYYFSKDACTAIAAIKTKSIKRSIKEHMNLMISGKKAELIMLVLLVFSIISYSGIPLKHPRYLFTLVLPAIYYSYIGLEILARKIKKPVVTLSIIIFIISFSSLLMIEDARSNGRPILGGLDYDSPDKYMASIDTLKNFGIENCSIMSNAWVLMNYLGQPSKEFPRQQFVVEEIENGEIMLFFFHTEEPEYVNNKTFMDSLPHLYKDDDYIMFGKENACLPQKVVDTTYLEKLDSIIYKRNNMHINTNPCIILFGNNPLLEKFCNFINLNSFRQDENRWTGA